MDEKCYQTTNKCHFFRARSKSVGYTATEGEKVMVVDKFMTIA